MTRTPWNWIITAFILAALLLTSFGMYRKEVKTNNSALVVKLKKDIHKMETQIESKDKTITKLQTDLDNEKKKTKSQPPKAPTSDGSQDVERLNAKIRVQQTTIDSQNKKIQSLQGQVRDLEEKVDWYRNN